MDLCGLVFCDLKYLNRWRQSAIKLLLELECDYGIGEGDGAVL